MTHPRVHRSLVASGVRWPARPGIVLVRVLDILRHPPAPGRRLPEVRAVEELAAPPRT